MYVYTVTQSSTFIRGSAQSIGIASRCASDVQAGQAAAEVVAIACAQAVQAAVAGCHPSQQALIYQLASSQLHQNCCQLPHTLVFPAANDPPGSFHPSTGPQQAGSSQQLATLHAREQFESTAAPEDAMSAANSTGIAHSLHSAEEMSRLLAQSAVVSAAAIAALHPDALPHDRAMPLLECLVKLAMQLPQGNSWEACMVAAAAVVNKWPAGGFSSVCKSKITTTYPDSVCNSVCENSVCENSVCNNVYKSLCNTVCNSVRKDSICHSVCNSICNSICNSVCKNVYKSFCNSVCSSVCNSVCNSVYKSSVTVSATICTMVSVTFNSTMPGIAAESTTVT